jgi:hypothetical protein
MLPSSNNQILIQSGQSEHLELIPHPHFLEKYLLDSINSMEDDSKDSSYAICQRTRNVFRVIAFSASALSGVPFIPIAQSAVSNATLGYILAANVVFSFALGSSWGWQNIIKNLNPDDEANTSSSYSRKRRFIVVPISILSGAATSIPSTYFTYIYNQDNRFWVVFNYIDSLGLHSFGFGELYNKIIDKTHQLFVERIFQYKNKELKLLRKAKTEFEVVIRRFNSLIISNSRVYEGYKVLLDQLERDQALTPKQKVAVIIGTIIEMSSANQPLPSAFYKKGMPRLLTRIIGNLLTPTSSTAVNCILAYGAVTLVTSNPILKALFVSVTTLAGGLIDYYTNDATYGRAFDSIYDLFHSGYKPNLAEIVHKKAYRTITALMLISGIGTALTALPSLRQELENQLKSDSQLILELVLLSLIGQCISKLYMSFDLVTDLFNLYSEKFGKIETKQLQKYTIRLDKLSTVVSASNLDDFKNAMSLCLGNEETRNKISNQHIYQALRKYSIAAARNSTILSDTVKQTDDLQEQYRLPSKGRKFFCGII